MNNPTWHPLSKLPAIAESIDGMLKDSATQLRNIEKTTASSCGLDDELAHRQCCVEILETLELYREQLRHWLKGKTSASEKNEIERLQKQLGELKTVLEKILSLCAESKKGEMNDVVESDTVKIATRGLNDFE